MQIDHAIAVFGGLLQRVEQLVFACGDALEKLGAMVGFNAFFKHLFRCLRVNFIHRLADLRAAPQDERRSF